MPHGPQTFLVERHRICFSVVSQYQDFNYTSINYTSIGKKLYIKNILTPQQNIINFNPEIYRSIEKKLKTNHSHRQCKKQLFVFPCIYVEECKNITNITNVIQMNV